VLGYGLDDRGFESQQGLGNFPFTTTFRVALGPTQPPIQWVPGALSLVLKWLEREADHSPPRSAEVSVWSYTSTPPLCLHGVVLSSKKKRTETTLPFTFLSLESLTILPEPRQNSDILNFCSYWKFLEINSLVAGTGSSTLVPPKPVIKLNFELL
jgi:hypothetical protein